MPHVDEDTAVSAQNTTTLSKKDRLILANQLLILEALYPDEAEGYAKQRKALEAGYALEYSRLFDHIDPELSVETCNFVLEVLDMYRCVTFANQRLPEKDQFPDEDIRFPGFDGNGEGALLMYASYRTEDLGQWAELTSHGTRPIPNSHWPMASHYEDMLAAWTASPDKHHLTRADVERILEARRA